MIEIYGLKLDKFNELHLEGYKIEFNKHFIAKVIILFWYVATYA
jgi:hypothetical protein